MDIEFSRFSPHQTEALVDFLTGESWPFHAIVQEAPAIRQRAAAGLYDDAENRTFWLLADGERAGLVRLQELTDFTPMFDLRIREAWRGRGPGNGGAQVAHLPSLHGIPRNQAHRGQYAAGQPPDAGRLS